MPICRDPLVALLNSWGFNALRCPRMDYVPASMLTRSRDGQVSFFGAWADAFTSPDIPPSHQGSALQYEDLATGRYRSRIGLKLLADWLGAMTGGLSSSVAGSHRVSFQLRDTRVLSIAPAAIANALVDAEPTSAMIELSGVRMFLLTDALQAKELIMIAEKDGTTEASLNLESLPGVPIAGSRGSVEADCRRASEGVVRFQCDRFHTIGYRVCEVEIADGEFRLSSSSRPTFGVQLTNTEAVYEPVIFEPDLL